MFALTTLNFIPAASQEKMGCKSQNCDLSADNNSTTTALQAIMSHFYLASQAFTFFCRQQLDRILKEAQQDVQQK